MKYLNAQIEVVKPKIIILCGNTAKRLFKINVPMKTVHGTCVDYAEIKHIPVYHPRASITDEVKFNEFKESKKVGR